MIRFQKLSAHLYAFTLACFVTSSTAFGFVQTPLMPLEIDYSNYQEHNFTGFILPNETHPQDAQDIWDVSTKGGVYVSVGTHRGIIGALATDSKYLVLVDSHVNAVIYNRALILLLKVADGRRDLFRNMMIDSATFKQTVKKDKLVLPEEKQWLLELGASKFWQALTEQQGRSRFFTENPTTPNQDFYRHNYLRDEDQFQRITLMAKENRIDAVQLDLSKVGEVSGLAKKLKKDGLTISVFDISNAWQGGKYTQNQYLGVELTRKMIKASKPALNEASRFLLTGAWQREPSLSQRRENLGKRWGYYSATWKELEEKKFFTAYFPPDREGRETFIRKFFPGTISCKSYLEGE